MDNGELLRQFDGALVKRGEGDVFPIFKREAIKNETKSLEAGRPIFDTVEMVSIIIPGDPSSVPERAVREHDKERWPEAYNRFKAEQEMVFDGTILEAWAILDAGQVAGLKALGIHTVESLANLPDAFLPKLGMGGLMLRDKARAYVEAAKNGGVPERLVQENAQLRAEREQLAATIAALKHQVEKLARETKVDISTIPVADAMASAREVVSKQAGDLPDGWQNQPVKKLIELCSAIGTAMTPRNREEALKLLAEYQGTRNALKG